MLACTVVLQSTSHLPFTGVMATVTIGSALARESISVVLVGRGPSEIRVPLFSLAESVWKALKMA